MREELGGHRFYGLLGGGGACGWDRDGVGAGSSVRERITMISPVTAVIVPGTAPIRAAIIPDQSKPPDGGPPTPGFWPRTSTTTKAMNAPASRISAPTVSRRNPLRRCRLAACCAVGRIVLIPAHSFRRIRRLPRSLSPIQCRANRLDRRGDT